MLRHRMMAATRRRSQSKAFVNMLESLEKAEKEKAEKAEKEKAEEDLCH